MDTLTIGGVIVGIIVGLLFAGFLFFVDDAFEKLIDRLLSLVGLRSHCGALHVTAKEGNESIEITIQNEGSSPAKFATIQAKDTSGNPFYTIPYLRDRQWKDSSGEKAQSQLRKNFVKEKLSSGSSLTVYVNKAELGQCSAHDLSLMDVHGKVWPIISRSS
jgi:hypothetical protein